LAEPSRHFPARTSEALARFCLSCAATVACWCVWLVLGATLAVQLYVLVARELPLPGFVRHQLEARLAAESFSLTFARAQFDPAGRLLLEDARLRLASYEDAVVVAESVFLRKSPWSLLSGARAPDEVRIQHATIRLPAPLSPSGTAEPLLRDVHAVLRLDGPIVHIDHLSFRLGPVAVSVSGEFALPARGGDRPPVGETVARLLRIAREAVRELPRLDCLERPALNVLLAARPGVGNIADLALSVGGVRQPLGSRLEFGPLTATTSLRLDGAGPRPVRIALAATSVVQEGAFAARGVMGQVATQIGLRPWVAPGDFVLEASARECTAWGERAEAPVAAVRWRSGDTVSASVAAAVRDSVLVASGTADPVSRSGRLTVRGAVPPALVDAVLVPRAPRLARHLKFAEPVEVEAEAEFSAGWAFAGLRSRVRGGALDSNGVAFTALRGRIDVDADGSFLAHDAHVEAGGNRAAGSYWMNLRTMDYRMLLTGRLQPPHIAPWFRSGWWSRFWEDIRFPGDAPRADVDVRGNWRDPDDTTYFGWTEAGPAVVRGADFERARVRVFVRPQFAHVFDLEVSRAGSAEWARGWFKRSADNATRSLRRLDYDLTGRLSPGILGAIGGEPAQLLLAPWGFGPPPLIAFQGRTEYRPGRADPEATFRGEATGPLTYEGFPLDRVRAAGGVSGGDVRIDSLEVEVAGGKGTAKASLAGTGDGRRLGFDFYLDGADLVRGIRALQTYEANHAKGQLQASPNAELLKRASGGRLNFALSAQGHPERLSSFAGSGNLEIAGAELGEVHLFGLLSQVLSGLSLNFSSLKLDTLRGSFRLGEGRVHFPDIRVTGPTALIDGKGDFLLEGRTLDFTAGFKPYEGNRNLITGVIGIVVNPLASILELRLTGPVSKPKWTVSLGGTPARAPAPALPAPNPPESERGRPTEPRTAPKASGD
jgi:hypothetical protein